MNYLRRLRTAKRTSIYENCKSKFWQSQLNCSEIHMRFKAQDVNKIRQSFAEQLNDHAHQLNKVMGAREHMASGHSYAISHSLVQ